MARLRVFKDGGEKAIPLENRVVSFGRLQENDIEISDSLVSRRHAEITGEAGEHYLQDLDSMNGTFVNGDKISRIRLRHGDRISIGREEFIFEDDSSSSTDVTPIPGAPAGGADHTISYNEWEGDGVSLPAAEPLARAAPPPPPPQAPGRPAEPAFPTGESNILKGDIVKNIFDFEDELKISHAGYEEEARGDIPAAQARTVEPSQMFYVLYQIGKVINAQNTLDELLDTAMNLIFGVINAERGALFLLNEETGKVALKKTVQRNKEKEEEPFKVSRTILRKVISDRCGILTSDAKYDPRFEEGHSIIQYNIRSALCVPLWEKKKILGAIYLDNVLETYAFNENDLDLLSAIANQVAIGVIQHRMAERFKKEAIHRSNLEMYHSPDVVEMIMKRSDGPSELGVQEREVTILFSDIRGFTSMSTRFSPAEVAEILNGYFEEMSKVIFRNKGSINKFIGDAIMAIFGAPMNLGNHAEAAVRTAIEMQQGLLAYLENLEERKRFQVRIGINTGEVVVGDIGSSKRKEYTAIGDAVNTAQRLESVAPPNGVLIGERTRQLIGNLFRVKDVGLLKLKGKDKATRAYEVLLT